MEFKRFLFVLLAIFTVICGQVSYGQEISLTVGGSTLIRTQSPIRKVIVGNPSIADVRETSPRELLVVGVGQGRTNIVVDTGDKQIKYSVEVTAVETGSLLEMIRSFIGRIEGIYTRVFGNTIIIEGEAFSAEDFGRAQRAVELFGEERVKNLVKFRPSAVEEINELFVKAGLGGVRASLVGGRIFLEGSVGSDEDLKKVEAVARAYGLKVENLVTKGRANMVEIDVEFVELRKNSHDIIGIEWPSAISGTGNLTGRLIILPEGQQHNLGVDVVAGVGLTINLLFSSGYARLLAQPRLVCTSGSEAEFLAGGEVPVVVTTDEVVSVNFKPFGVKLKVLPITDASGNISLNLDAEVSQVDESLRVMGVPGFRTRRVSTTVVVKSGQTIVLGGLFSNEDQKAVSKFPLLGHIPIIGELFRSRDFRSGRSNLVVFVTPYIVNAETPRIQKTIKNIQNMYQESKDEVGWEFLEIDTAF